MRRTMRVIGVLCAVLLGLLSAPVTAGGYGVSEIKSTARKLAKKLEMPDGTRDRLMELFDAELKSKGFKKTTKKSPVKAVFLYRVAEGGFVVKFLKGRGLISFKGGKQAGRIQIKSWSVGAQAGGSTQWGVGMALGLKKQADFGGTYEGNVEGATAAVSTTGKGNLLTLVGRGATDRAHDLYLVVVSAKGLSAGVASARLQIKPDF